MLGALLTPLEWQRVIPRLAPHARALLRQRRDLPHEARDALLGFGHSDFAIASSDDAGKATNENTQIRDLMARIANWREQRDQTSTVETAEPFLSGSFRFEADASGSITWTDWPNRAQLIGMPLAETHGPREFGFDAHAAGAFAKRTSFRHARLTLPEARTWSVAGDPIFRMSDGRFLGYRCVAGAFIAAAPVEAVHSSGDDTFRQVAHELRTPLNAVHGFAAMIEAQLLGPVGESYRRRALEINRDAVRVLTVIDDLDGWSRDVDAGGGATDLAAVVASVSENCRAIEAERGAKLHFRLSHDLSPLAVGEATASRLIYALARVSLSAARQGEALICEIRDGANAIVSFVKPAALHEVDPDELVSDAADVGDDAENVLPLGLGFTLRMVKAQAQAAGGSLDMTGEALVLRLPVAADSAVGASESR